MDQKIWLWRKKSTEKAILSSDKLNISQKDNEEEVQTPVTDKRELENELYKLNQKLTAALSDCSYKDELVKEHRNNALQATAGMEKAESKAASLKQELDEALQQKVASEERVTNLDAALKECMRQLRFVRQEQEQRIHDAVMNASKEFEISKKNFEEQLAETRKRVTKLGVENANLSKALLVKEKVIDDLNKQRARIETNLSALLTRLESTEKDNAAFNYKVRVLEKELEIRNEEREFYRRTAEASHKQHLESDKKIAKLESECQRLRVLIRKRLLGPAALAKMKSEVEMMGRGSIDMRTRKLNPSSPSLEVDFAVDSCSDSSSKMVNILTEQLCAIEEKNMVLENKTSELQFSRAMYAQIPNKSLDVESRLEPSKSPSNSESTKNDIMLSSMSDVGIDDKASSAESWAPALSSELEHFRNEQIRKSLSCKTVASSEIYLMDDFVEMEKLALISVDKLSRTSHVSSDEASETLGPLQTGSNGNALDVMCKELVLVPGSPYDHSMLNNEMKSKSPLVSKVPGPPWDIPKANLEQTHATQRNPDDMLVDIKGGLACMGYPKAADSFDEKEGSNHNTSCDPSCISGHMSWKQLDCSSKVDLCNEDADVNICSEDAGNQQFHPDLSKSICRIIELIEGISLPPPDYNIPETLTEKNPFPYKHSEIPSGYVVRVFQWKTSELGAVLQQFVQACYDLLNGKADLGKFTQELTSGLDWIINHCFSLQDVSSMRDAIKNHFDWDESESESEEGVMIDHFAQPNVREEKMKPRDELVNEEATKQHFEDKLQSTTNKSNSLINQLKESEKAIEKLQVELDALRKTEEMDEVNVETQIRMNVIYDNPLSSTKYKIDEACQNFPSQDLESKIKNSCHEEFETNCLVSVTEKELPKSEVEQEGNQFRTNHEISIASEKLAECQETILNLGKQLKALASPKEAALFDNVISTQTETIAPTTLITIPTPPRKKLISRRPSLLDQMIMEDKAKVKGNPSSFHSNGTTPIAPTDSTLVLNRNKQPEDNAAVNSLAIVPGKKQGGSLWNKVFRRKGFRC